MDLVFWLQYHFAWMKCTSIDQLNPEERGILASGGSSMWRRGAGYPGPCGMVNAETAEALTSSTSDMCCMYRVQRLRRLVFMMDYVD